MNGPENEDFSGSETENCIPIFGTRHHSSRRCTPLKLYAPDMNYIEIADTYINLHHVAFVRKEEHSQLGPVLAIHFAVTGAKPLFIGEQHYEELRPVLLNSDRVQNADA